MAKEKIEAVYDDQLNELLDNLGELGKFKRGKLKCSFCNIIITWKNLHSLFPDSGAIKYCCDAPECVKGLHQKQGRK